MTAIPEPEFSAPFSSLSLADLELAVAQKPLNVDLHRLMFDRKHQQGDELGALAHLIAAKAIDAYLTDDGNNAAWQLYLVATGYFMKGDYAIAERWYQIVLTLDPNLAAAYQNLVVIHLHFGRHAEAEVCRARAYQIQRVFIDPVVNPVRQLLILCVGRTQGNIPYEVLLSAETSQRIKYIIDYADVTEDAQLPPYDLAFNAIGEPDVAAPLAERLDRFIQTCQRPILNLPTLVARTQRHLLSELMTGLENVVVAPCVRMEAEPVSAEQLQANIVNGDIHFPVLVRPAGSHGGQGLVRCDDLVATLTALQSTDSAHYLSSFIDCRSADGYFRKYRIIYVDKQPFAYHLAISNEWMVHYHSADMVSNAWKIAEEKLFLQNTAAVLGEPAMAALVQIGQRLNLDYAGIDFALLPDGQVFIFEANATMLVHRVASDGLLAHKNPYIQRIADAFEQMQVRRISNLDSSNTSKT
ncbi:ATP-grasp domain-containing protein [Solimicrobium silvestre]|uniref:ATP-grasp domain-containing protein n=1 Tax=Solimicrobium silvestre TaxID=2099400 RepID=A0A2S9GZK2_9BURK|nr:hypothetical protein [Solimicrobium silvestre]PRC93137.1 hypothetical protein S2091_2223 [Solimicrobium silvestre]